MNKLKQKEFEEVYEKFIINSTKNINNELRLMVAYEVMRKIGFTTFQKNPQRVPILFKLLISGRVVTKVRHKKISLEIPDVIVIFYI